MINRKIPSTQEDLPVIGLGTWQTFDVPSHAVPSELHQILQTMRMKGSTLVDTSPMYGNAESVIGELTSDDPGKDYFFYATKVWTTGKAAGIQQLESSFHKMRRKTMDLVQVHNLTDWETQLGTLRDWKAQGRIRYIGITHYTDSSHDQLVRILKAEKPEFVQFNYSIFSRNAEKKLLHTAADLGVAILINRPFGTGNDFSRVKGKELPAWARELGITTWSQFFLAYILSEPAVTCVIPATGDPAHLSENLQAGLGNLPNQLQRSKMIEYITNL